MWWSVRPRMHLDGKWASVKVKRMAILPFCMSMIHFFVCQLSANQTANGAVISLAAFVVPFICLNAFFVCMSSIDSVDSDDSAFLWHANRESSGKFQPIQLVKKRWSVQAHVDPGQLESVRISSRCPERECVFRWLTLTDRSTSSTKLIESICRLSCRCQFLIEMWIK